MSITRDFKEFFSHENPEPKMLAPSGFVAVHDLSLCVGCGACSDACPFDAVQCQEEKQPSVIWEKCFGCGICVEKCASRAITLKRDEAKGIPLNLEALLQEDAR
jgi:ferredoxin